MSRSLRARLPGLAFLAVAATLLGMPALGGVPVTTECDSDPNAVDFKATGNPDVLNILLSQLGAVEIDPLTPFAFSFPGFCGDHQVFIAPNVAAVPVGDAPFTVTPTLGSVQVDLSIFGPFEAGLNIGNHSLINCDNDCVIDLPYVGEVFDGCSLEEDAVGLALAGGGMSVSWDDIEVTQVADTCVQSECLAIHPLESSTASVNNLDVAVTGLGTCEFCLDFPDPLPDICFDPCPDIGGLVEETLEPALETALNTALDSVFLDSEGRGILIEFFSGQIKRDFFGCLPIPEVRECLANQGNPPVASATTSPASSVVNGLFYLLPLALAGGLTVRLRLFRG